MMALYFTAYNLIEQNALPVSLPSKSFGTQSWGDGYFHASGSFDNQSAINPSDELLPQGNAVTCVKDAKTCTVATGSVFDGYLDVDLEQFDISSVVSQ
jgi:hypothetical protein